MIKNKVSQKNSSLKMKFLDMLYNTIMKVYESIINKQIVLLTQIFSDSVVWIH